MSIYTSALDTLKRDIDHLFKELERARNQLADERKKSEDFRNRLIESINENHKLKKELEKEREESKKQKVKFLWLNGMDPNFLADYKDLCDEHIRLIEENEILYQHNAKLEKENEEMALQVSYSDEITSMYQTDIETYKSEIDELKLRLQQQRGKLISQEITMNSYKEKRKPILIAGKEEEYCSGEQKDFVIEMIEKYIESMDPWTRKYIVLKSILDANPKDGSKDRIEEGLEDIMNGATSAIDLQVYARDFKELGFTLEFLGSGHCRLLYHNDKRLSVSICNTSSDKKRNAQNALCDIRRIFF